MSEQIFTTDEFSKLGLNRLENHKFTLDSAWRVAVRVIMTWWSSDFLWLTDTPNSFTGEALKFARVNAGETALEFVTIAGWWDMLKSENLSWLVNYVTARTNLWVYSIADVDSALALKSDTSHLHTWIYEPVFAKNTWFNLVLWTWAWQVSEWNHIHTWMDVILSNVWSPTYITAQEMQDIYHSSGWASWWLITDNLDGTISVATWEWYIKATASPVDTLYACKWLASLNIALTSDSNNYVYIEYNAGTPQVVVTTTKRTDLFTNIYLAVIYKNWTTTLHINNEVKYTISDHAGAMIQRLQATMPFAREWWAMMSEAWTRSLVVSAWTFWEWLNQFSTSAFDSSVADTFTCYYRDWIWGWTKILSATQVDNTQYDDNSGTLATLANNQYWVHWVYLDTDDHINMIFGRDTYTISEAQEANPFWDLPPQLETQARLLGKIIIQKSATSFSEIQSAFDKAFVWSPVTAHVDLTWLQGWTTAEYYHLTSAEYTIMQNTSGTNTWDVTLAWTPDYITIAGQVITRALVNLASHITWNLPVTNLNSWTWASATTFWRWDGTRATPAGWWGSWDVVWPASSTDNALARFDLATWKLLQNSVVLVSDTWNLTWLWTLNGNPIATGTNTGDQTTITGNAWSATILQTARTIWGVSFNWSANINLPWVNIAWNQNTTWSAATLTTARTINWVSFNWSTNITVPSDITPWTSGNVLTSNWSVWQSTAPSWGDVSWPASSVDDRIATFNWATWKIIQDWWKILTDFVDRTTTQSISWAKTFNTFPITPSGAPFNDYQVANKKYVDDNAWAFDTAHFMRQYSWSFVLTSWVQTQVTSFVESVDTSSEFASNQFIPSINWQYFIIFRVAFTCDDDINLILSTSPYAAGLSNHAHQWTVTIAWNKQYYETSFIYELTTANILKWYITWTRDNWWTDPLDVNEASVYIKRVW